MMTSSTNDSYPHNNSALLGSGPQFCSIVRSTTHFQGSREVMLLLGVPGVTARRGRNDPKVKKSKRVLKDLTGGQLLSLCWEKYLETSSRVIKVRTGGSRGLYRKCAPCGNSEIHANRKIPSTLKTLTVAMVRTPFHMMYDCFYISI